jgi:uncharacterized protein (DUF1684 family)
LWLEPPRRDDPPVAQAADVLALLDWKRRVFDLYAEVRRSDDPKVAWRRWRAGRDELFRAHPQSPLPGHGPLSYFDYDDEWRIVAPLRDAVSEPVAIGASGGATVPFRPFALADLVVAGEHVSLELYWLEGYGGGVFLPFGDATNGRETYGGGRYLLDTVKGADLGTVGDELVLDFNFAYNPSCSYAPHWVCPLSPSANRLADEVRAGERHAAPGAVTDAGAP